MSAPSTAYLTEVLPISNGTTTDALYLAIDLSAYAGNMKDLFYVDFFLSVDKGSTKGVIGVVEDNSSLFNYKQHNSARFSKLRLKNPAGTKTYIVMNDGGLNTKGSTIDPTTISNQNGNISVKTSSLKSAFYVNSSVVGIEIASNNTFTADRDWNEDALNQNLELVDYGVNTGANFAIGTTLYYRSYVKNAEGDTYSTIKTLIVKPRIVSLRFGATITDAAAASYADYLIDINRLNIGTNIYNDNIPHTLITPSTVGYYDDGTYVYETTNVGGLTQITAIGFSGVEGSTGGSGSPSYVTWTTWSSNVSAFKAYQAYTLGKVSADYNVYDPEVGGGLQRMPSAEDGFYAHVVGTDIYVHEVISEEVQTPASAIYPI